MFELMPVAQAAYFQVTDEAIALNITKTCVLLLVHAYLNHLNSFPS